MSNKAKLLALTAGLVASVACISNGLAQAQSASPPAFQDMGRSEERAASRCSFAVPHWVAFGYLDAEAASEALAW